MVTIGYASAVEKTVSFTFECGHCKKATKIKDASFEPLWVESSGCACCGTSHYVYYDTRCSHCDKKQTVELY